MGAMNSEMTVPANVRQISTILPDATRASQKRTAARVIRNTNRNEIGVKKGDIIGSIDIKYSSTLVTSTPPDDTSFGPNENNSCQHNPQMNRAMSGDTSMEKLRPRMEIIFEKKL